MRISKFWAKTLGLYTLILSVGFYLKPHLLDLFLAEFVKTPGLVTVMGIFTLLVGIGIIMSHPIWRGWPILVTLMGYLIMAKGIFLTFWPGVYVLIKNIPALHTYGMVPSFVVGALLLLLGMFSKCEKKDS